MAKRKADAPQRRYEQNHKAAGLCRVCPKPATHGIWCKKHHSKALDSQRKRNGVKNPYKKKH